MGQTKAIVKDGIMTHQKIQDTSVTILLPSWW